eukprot:1161605-Pelagomonas_calceolata.AAC.11
MLNCFKVIGSENYSRHLTDKADIARSPYITFPLKITMLRLKDADVTSPRPMKDKRGFIHVRGHGSKQKQ